MTFKRRRERHKIESFTSHRKIAAFRQHRNVGEHDYRMAFDVLHSFSLNAIIVYMAMLKLYGPGLRNWTLVNGADILEIAKIAKSTASHALTELVEYGIFERKSAKGANRGSGGWMLYRLCNQESLQAFDFRPIIEQVTQWQAMIEELEAKVFAESDAQHQTQEMA